LPVTVALVLLFNRSALEREASETGPPVTATPTGTPSLLPPVPVDPPSAAPATARACAPLAAALPATLTGLAGRPVQPATPLVAAWGEPPVVLRCGVGRPAGFVVGAQTLVVNGVTWFTEDAAGTLRWTAVDRPVYVEADVPSGYASGPVAALSATVADALPARPIRPRR
jgi:Protein of unknown function (DUF3515)